MHALVADVAVAGVPDPVPVIGELILAVWFPLRRTQEQIPIETGRHGFIGRVADRKPAPETERSRMIDLAYRALIDQLGRSHLVWERAALGAHLNHAVIFAGGGDHLPALENIVAGGLFPIDVPTCPARPDGCKRVPMIRRSGRYGIDVLGLELCALIAALLG